MKNILLLCLLFCLTILGCDKEKSGTPKSGNDYYMFSITIDGVTHKVEGNYGNTAPTATNFCYAGLFPSGAVISAGLADKGAASYISGEVFSLNLNFSNLSLGINECSSLIFTNNFQWPETTCGWVENNFIGNLQTGDNISLDNLIVTNLGSTGTYNPGNISNPYNWGDPVIGSFSGTVYGCSTNSFGTAVYDVPVQLEIEFVAPRLAY